MRPYVLPLVLLVALPVGGCKEQTPPQYSLSGGEAGVFRSANAGRPIPLVQIKGMDQRQLVTTFGKPKLDRRDGVTRTLRYNSDACVLFVYMNGDRVEFADALDPQMRPLPPDACAGSVAAQKRDIG